MMQANQAQTIEMSDRKYIGANPLYIEARDKDGEIIYNADGSVYAWHKVLKGVPYVKMEDEDNV